MHTLTHVCLTKPHFVSTTRADLDLSDNKAAKNKKPKKSAPAPPPKAMKPPKALKSAPAPPPKAMKPPSGQENYLDVDASKKAGPATLPKAAPPPLPSAPPPTATAF